ncbi:hypothetical protein U1Q18_002047 [Sarracenia purpurea var. burkii]
MSWVSHGPCYTVGLGRVKGRANKGSNCKAVIKLGQFLIDLPEKTWDSYGSNRSEAQSKPKLNFGLQPDPSLPHILNVTTTRCLRDWSEEQLTGESVAILVLMVSRSGHGASAALGWLHGSVFLSWLYIAQDNHVPFVGVDNIVADRGLRVKVLNLAHSHQGQRN